MVLGIYGAGGLGREVLQLVREINDSKLKYNDVYFIDDYTDKLEVNNIKVFKYIDIKRKFNSNEIEIVIALGEPSLRMEKAKEIKIDGYKLAILIHPNVIIPNDTIISEGVVINKFSNISLNIKIGFNTYIQPLSAIGHDSIIGENSVISTHSTISGNCCIGDNTYIAINVPIREGVTIGNNCIIGMGSVITHNVEDNMITAGALGRIVKRPKGKKVF